MTLKVDGTNGVLQAYDYQVLTTGFSYTFASGTQTLIANPAGTLATGTITMPASPVDGMTITITSTQEISTLTVNGNTGQSIVGTPGVLPANTAIQFVYRLSNTTWYSNTISPKGTLCRAWMNYKGTATRAINGSFNVSSVTYNSTGNYTINFTNAMPDANYSVALSYSSTNNGGWQVMCFAESYTTSNFNVNSIGTDTTYTSASDKSIVSVAIFR